MAFTRGEQYESQRAAVASIAGKIAARPKRCGAGYEAEANSCWQFAGQEETA
jgi:hypothetical protein